jgi:hypothetical protein
VKNNPTWPFICYGGLLGLKSAWELGLTWASLCSPIRCSSSTVVPRALAITAPRPKNIRAELQVMS